MMTYLGRKIADHVKNSDFEYEGYKPMYYAESGAIEYAHTTENKSVWATPFWNEDVLPIAGVSEETDWHDIDLANYDLTPLMDKYGINDENWFENEEFVKWYHNMVMAAIDEFEEKK